MKMHRRFSFGFTLVEMMVIAPIVILAVGAFVTVIVTLTGDILSSRGSNVLAYNIQDALDRIEQDVKLSSGFLAKNSITFSSSNPQGYGVVGSTTDFSSVGGSSGTSLILSSAATDGNPLSTSSKMLYMANQPNACDSYATYSKNTPMLTNIIYFVDSSGTLWRRTVMPLGYDDPAAHCGAAGAWQQPSCQTDYTSSFCKTHDVKLVSGLGTTGFSINYYPTANSTVPSSTAIDPSDVTRKAALKSMQTVSVTINSTDSIAGRDISRSGTVRVTRLDTNATAIADTVVTTPPTTPVVSSTVSNGSTVNFTWPRVPTASSYTLDYNINGGAWVAAPGPFGTNNRSFSLAANHEDTINVRVKAVNSAGSSASYGTASLQIPFWAPLLLNGNWTQYGNGYAIPEFSRSSSGLVVLKGLIKKSTATSSGEIIATLPQGYRPTGKLMFGITTNANASGRIDIDTSGNVILTTGDAAWVSLDSIRFMADGTGMSNIPSYTRNALTLSNGWTNYNNGWATASYVVDNKGRVVTQGLLNTGTITNGTLIAAIPSSLRSAKLQILSSRSNSYNEFALYPTQGITTSGYGSGAYSLNAFWFPASPSPALTWNNMTLQNGWVSYDSGVTYELPQYSKTSGENMVSLKGLIKGGSTTFDSIITTLPAGYRPEGRLIYTSDDVNSFARLDILANGEVHFMGSNNAWQSLDGITFHADQ